MMKLIKKIHLWLSVPFGIFITLICFSGAMLVFEKEITENIQSSTYFVEPLSSGAMEIEDLTEAVAATLPDSVSITGVKASDDPTRAYEVAISIPHQSVYVNQYTGEVTGKTNRLPFFATMFKLHRWLLGSPKGADGSISLGKLVVGCSTLALIFIVITGVVLCAMRGGKGFLKCFRISFKNGWKRFFYDLHVAGGLYATIFLLALALTGLTWSFQWYRTGFYSAFGVEAPAGGHGGQGAKGGHGERGGRPGENGGRPEGREAHFEGRGGRPEGGFEGRGGRPEGKDGHFEGRKNHGGELSNNKPNMGDDKSSKVRAAIYATHVGSWGGIVTRILTFIAVLIGATLPLTGYYLWLKRIVRKKRA